jgi:hypothetical protein
MHWRAKNCCRCERSCRIDYWSPYYHEREHRALFYAQSWALVHFLLSDKSGVRQAQLVRYLEAAAGESIEESFRQAFQMDMGRMEGEFRAYVRAARYAGRREVLAEPLPPAPKLENRALSEPEAQAYLGDLLLHTDRPDDAEEYLARALKLDAISRRRTLRSVCCGSDKIVCARRRSICSVPSKSIR